MRGPGLGTYGIIQSLELQFRLHNLLLQRIGKCISFGCNQPPGQEQMLQVSRRVSEGYPHRVLERASYTHADSNSWGSAAMERSAVLNEVAQLQSAVEAAAKLANRGLLESLLKGSTSEGTARTKIDAETVHIHTQMMQHVPPTPSTLIGLSRFGQQEQQEPRVHGKHAPTSSIPETWIAWHLMDEHAMAIVMQSFVYSRASGQFVAVVDETLAVEQDGMDLAHWAEANPKALSLFLRGVNARRDRAHEWWSGTISMLRMLEQNTWDRPDAVEDMGGTAATAGAGR